jgi:hypothetical protein
MGLMNILAKLLDSPRDPQTLYVTIVEMPQPRDWGTLSISVGSKAITSRDIALDFKTVNETVAWVQCALPSIKKSNYQRVEYHNVSSKVQELLDPMLAV